jgi:HPt (histidine-containing phosphotransfer) domain-containing protein
MIDVQQREAIHECLGARVVAELLEAFWQDLPDQLTELLAALESADGAEVADRVLHTFKGTAGSLGYAGIAEASQGVRNALRVHADVAGALARLRAVLQRTRRDDTDLAGLAPAERLEQAWERAPA